MTYFQVSRIFWETNECIVLYVSLNGYVVPSEGGANRIFCVIILDIKYVESSLVDITMRYVLLHYI